MSKFIILGLLGLIVFLGIAAVQEADAALDKKNEEDIKDEDGNQNENENENINVWKEGAKNFCVAFDNATGLKGKPKLDECIGKQEKDVHTCLKELIETLYIPKIKAENFYYDKNTDKNVALQKAIRDYYGIFDTLKVSYTRHLEYGTMLDLDLALTGYDSQLNAVAQPAGQNQVQPNVVNQTGT